MVAARASAGAAGEGPRRPLGALDRAYWRRQDAGRISADAGGAECTGAIFSPHPAKRRGGGGGGGCLYGLLFSQRASAKHPPPRPPTPHALRARGEGRRRSQRLRVRNSFPPDAACSAAAASTRST